MIKTATSIILQPGNPECQDRAEILTPGERTILVLADGAGGISGGAQAADRFLQLVQASADHLKTAEDCVQLLARVDQELARREECGETTGIIAIIDPNRIFGASVGDSAAWFFANDGHGELTRGQHRKPLLGTGEIAPARPFDWASEDGTVVVASDGLWNYASLEAILSRVRSRGTADLAVRLAELVRLQSGAFPDDVAIITCNIVQAST